MTGPLDGDGASGSGGSGFPRIPGPRPAADNLDPLPDETPPPVAPVDTESPAGTKPPAGTEAREDVPQEDVPHEEVPHAVLMSLLGAWALSACSADETTLVEDHLTECAACADEALRLRDAVELLRTDRSLDLDPRLRSRVLASCLSRRPARIPVPDWAAPYDAETARLDALLRDIGESEWHTAVRLRWFEHDKPVSRNTTVAGVIGHLFTVDGLVAAALGLDDPLTDPEGAEPEEHGAGRPAGLRTPPVAPTERTERFWRAGTRQPAVGSTHERWREQSHSLVRTVSFAGRGAAELSVSYGDFALPLRDALLERAFECWVHGADIAEAVAYPYDPPSAAHLHGMVDLAARLLPATLAARRRGGLAAPARHLVAAGAEGRSLHLEVEGAGGGDWYIPLDSPGAIGSPDRAVAQVALDGIEFCQLVAGHVAPEEAAAGQDGDREAIRDVLFAAAAMSRL